MIKSSTCCKTLLIALTLWMILLKNGYTQDHLIISTGVAGDATILLAEPVIREAYARLGITVEIRNYPWRRALAVANDGVTDGELFRVKTIQKEFPNLVIVNEPVAYIEILVFTKNTQIKVDGWESLRPYRLGFVMGLKEIEEQTQGMQVYMADTNETIFKLLQRGRFDIAIEERFAGLKALKEMNINDIHFLLPPIEKYPLYHFLHTRHVSLVPKVERVLKQLEQEGFIEAVNNKIIKEYSQ